MKKLLALLSVLLISCGTSTPDAPEKNDRDPEVKARVESIREWLPYCKYPNDFIGVSKDTCVSEGTGRGDGDIVAYAGWLCFSGEELGCETVRRSIDTQCRVWRSPGRIGVDTNDSFSRDMLLGLLGYFVKTKDTARASCWMDYVESIGNKLCPDATDNKCNLTTPTWGTLKEVWNYLKLTPTTNMKLNGLIDDEAVYLQALTQETGYGMELTAFQIYLRQYMGTYTQSLKKAAETLVKRQPQNPFFEFVYRGKTERFISLLLKQAPNERPNQRYQWSITRDTNEQAWKDSMGWEWVYLYNLGFTNYKQLHLDVKTNLAGQ